MTHDKQLERVSPYRPVPVAVPEPKQTWWGRFTWIRRWIGGTWELRWHDVAVVPLQYTQWYRVNEPSEPATWREGAEHVTVLAVERDGHIDWSAPGLLFERRVVAWDRRGVRRRLGGRWELWTHRWAGGPCSTCKRWVPVNAFTFEEQRRLHHDADVIRREHYFDGRVITQDADGDPLPDNGLALQAFFEAVRGDEHPMASKVYDWIHRKE